MSETTPSPQPAGQAPTPPLVVNIQYVKDLSFEVPGAPQVYTQLRGAAPGQHQPGCAGASRARGTEHFRSRHHDPRGGA